MYFKILTLKLLLMLHCGNEFRMEVVVFALNLMT